MSNPCYKEIAKEVALCQTLDRCPHDCESIKYNYQTERRKLTPELVEMNGLIHENRVIIKLRSDQSTGNIIETHVPLMTSGQLFSYIFSIITIFSGLSIIGFTNLIIEKILSIQCRSSLVSDQQISAVNADKQIQQSNRWRIKKNKSKRKSDCISSCVGTPQKQRIPWKKTTTSIYSSNIVDVISVQK